MMARFRQPDHTRGDANTLGGYIDAADGTRLTFAFYAIGSSRAAALPALDAVTAATYRCGGNLTSS